MCAIINNKLIDNLPPALTSKLVNRHFPACDSCPHGNLANRADTIAPTTYVTNEVYDKGEVWQVDNGGPITNENGKICPTLSGMRYYFLAHDQVTDLRLRF